VLCLHGNNTDNQVGTRQLLNTGSLAGAHKQQYQMQRGSVEKSELVMVVNDDRSSVLTARAIDGGVKLDSPSRVDNCLARQCDTVINRRGQLGRWPRPVERYDSRLCADLYPYWQDIWLKMLPIMEQDECCDSTATTSSKVSRQKTDIITPLSSSVIFSHCSAESGNVADNNTSDGSAVPCVLTSGQRAEQRRIVADGPAAFPQLKPPNDVIAISGQGELDGCFSCDNNARQMTMCDQQAMQKFEDIFPETLRKSTVKNKRAETSKSSSSTSCSNIHGWKSVSRPLYGSLQRHKRRCSSFSSKKSEWTLPKSRFPANSSPFIGHQGAPVGQEYRDKAKTSHFYRSTGNEAEENMNWYGSTCMEAINCIARMSRQMQFEIANMFWQQQNKGQMESEIDELRREKVDQSRCRSNNGQSTEVFTTNSTRTRGKAEVAFNMPAARLASITSAPTQQACVHQLRERDIQNSNTCFDVSLSENCDMYTSNNYRKFTVPVSEFSSRNCFGQNAIPRVRMARTKMTARKDRDDRRRDDERRSDDRRFEERRGREPAKPPARRRRRGTPPPEKYICIFCQKENQQRINHKRHLIMQHHCRMDGTPATADDIAQARAWSSRTPADRGGQFKSKEFVESTASEDDGDTTPGPSIPARRKSRSPPRRKQARREQSISPRRSTLSPPRASTSLPTSMLKVRKVRFEGKKESQTAMSRPKAKAMPAETVMTATASSEIAKTAQRSHTVAASTQHDGRARTAKQKDAQTRRSSEWLSKPSKNYVNEKTPRLKFRQVELKKQKNQQPNVN